MFAYISLFLLLGFGAFARNFEVYNMNRQTGRHTDREGEGGRESVYTYIAVFIVVLAHFAYNSETPAY